MDLEEIKIDSHEDMEVISELNSAYKNGVKSGKKFVVIYYSRDCKWKTVTFDGTGYPIAIHYGWPSCDD